MNQLATPTPNMAQTEMLSSTPIRRKILSWHEPVALLLVLFSFFMSALVSRTVFERLPHLEDEVAYLWEAKALAGGHAVIDSPPVTRAFWQPFVVDYNGKRFGKYSLGWPAMLAVGVTLGQTWVINAFLSAMTVALVYRLGREVFNPDVGVIAAALTAFSPMALLLNGTLMGHTAALFGVTLFLYAYWRIGRERQALRWGLIAGVALGVVLINRPLTAVAIAMPFVVWSGVKLARGLLTVINNRRGVHVDAPPTHTFYWHEVQKQLTPLLALTAVTMLITMVIPLYNYAATGDPKYNLYTRVWSYDRIGFGEGYGQHGHTFEKAVRHTRFDLSLTAADLFGWQVGEITPELKDHLLNEGDYWQALGLSWILLPVGILVRLRQKSWLAALWLLATGAWVMLPLEFNQELTQTPWIAQLFEIQETLITSPKFAWFWLAVGATLLLLPVLFLRDIKPDQTVGARDASPPHNHAQIPQFNWTWLLMIAALMFIFVQFTYWIGSQRYTTRYYYEALTATALLSALPLAWLARRWQRWPIYALLLAVLIYSLYAYSTPRISVLYRFNKVSPELIEQVQARRVDDRPVLVVISGPGSGEDMVRWRAYGSLMVSTSPYLNSDIVAAWNTLQPGMYTQILALFPDRQVINMQAKGNDSWFGE